MAIYFMKPARRGASDATRRRIVGDYLAERARRRHIVRKYLAERARRRFAKTSAA